MGCPGWDFSSRIVLCRPRLPVAGALSSTHLRSASPSPRMEQAVPTLSVLPQAASVFLPLFSLCLCASLSVFLCLSSFAPTLSRVGKELGVRVGGIPAGTGDEGVEG